MSNSDWLADWQAWKNDESADPPAPSFRRYCEDRQEFEAGDKFRRMNVIGWWPDSDS